MPQRPSPITLRAVRLLREGPMAEDVLICHLWPLVDPGIAYRRRQYDRERSLARNRSMGLHEIKRRELTATEAVEIGSRRKIAEMIKAWAKYGIVEREIIDGRKHVRLVREPEGSHA